MMGAERKSRVVTDEEKLLTAYHEGGHAIVALNVTAADPVHKATIVPRGRKIGMVVQLPEHDRLSISREQMIARLTIVMGGRVAEEIVFGREKVTSGAASDIEQATTPCTHDGDALGSLRGAGDHRLCRESGRSIPRLFGSSAPEHFTSNGGND